MSDITIKNSSALEVTLLSDHFIDYYMPEANGEFVKVYICLLRTLSKAPASFSLSAMADTLQCTERDILRACRYWAKENLLSLTFEEGEKLTGISILPVPKQESSSKEGAACPLPPSASALPRQASSQPVSLTRDRVKELKQNEDIVQLLYLAEQYMGKTLTSTETQKLLYFYDELKLSVDLIEYLIEYCVSRNHCSIRYMEKVALNWAQNDIRTVEKAKQESSLHNKDYFRIMKSLGITNRVPVDSEITIMNAWRQEYGFSMELIFEACSRTVLQTGQSSFQYADRILQGWKKKSVKNMADVVALDVEYKQKKQERAEKAKEAKGSSQKPASSGNRFNNFTQRDYDFQEYEKRLLNH